MDTKLSNVPEFETHVNLWFLEDHAGINPKIEQPYLDIGIRIKNYMNLESFILGCPFPMEDRNLQDLSDVIKEQSNAQLIFNDDCEVETNTGYTAIKMSEADKILIFPLHQACDLDAKIIPDATFSTIEIKMEPFFNYIDQEKAFDKIEEKYQTIYFRFRIKDIDLKDIVFFDSEQLNKSFESAFSATRVLDFKINKSRNIENTLLIALKKRGYEFVKFSKIHFLIMAPSAYDMTQFSDSINCRELEDGLWNSYFGQEIDFHKGHVLAYHWKQTPKGADNSFDEFSCFAKITYRKMREKTLFAYSIIVIALGMIGSALVTIIQNMLSHISLTETGLHIFRKGIIDGGSIGAIIFAILFYLLGRWIGSQDS